MKKKLSLMLVEMKESEWTNSSNTTFQEPLLDTLINNNNNVHKRSKILCLGDAADHETGNNVYISQRI